MNKNQANNTKRKVIIWGLGISAASVLGYFGFMYAKRKKMETSYQNTGDFTFPPIASDFTPKPSLPSSSSGFPLKKGSRGSQVVSLQKALIAQHGANILPKYGADGIFGSEVEAALRSIGQDVVVSESRYSAIVKSIAINPATTASSLRQAAMQKDHSKVIGLLKTMNTQQDYRTVGDEFLKLYIGGVRKTLVNGLLDAGFTEDQKQQIRLQFTRMGLNYDGQKWSLDGLDGLPLIAKTDIVVWKDQDTPIKLPKGVILGRELNRQGNKVWFKHGGQEFLVTADSVGYLTK